MLSKRLYVLIRDASSLILLMGYVNRDTSARKRVESSEGSKLLVRAGAVQTREGLNITRNRE